MPVSWSGKALGSPTAAVQQFLKESVRLNLDGLFQTSTDNTVVRGILPGNNFRRPADLDGLLRVSRVWNVSLMKDAAEYLDNLYKGQDTGTFDGLGVTSLNSYKTKTTCSGGMNLANAPLGEHARHLTTTPKKQPSYGYINSKVDYKYRLPNVNAALGCAKPKNIEISIELKRALARAYNEQRLGKNLKFVKHPKGCRSSCWLNKGAYEDKTHRYALPETTHQQGVITRLIWASMKHLRMFLNCFRGDLTYAELLEARVANFFRSAVF